MEKLRESAEMLGMYIVSLAKSIGQSAKLWNTSEMQLPVSAAMKSECYSLCRAIRDNVAPAEAAMSWLVDTCGADIVNAMLGNRQAGYCIGQCLLSTHETAKKNPDQDARNASRVLLSVICASLPEFRKLVTYGLPYNGSVIRPLQFLDRPFIQLVETKPKLFVSAVDCFGEKLTIEPRRLIYGNLPQALVESWISDGMALNVGAYTPTAPKTQAQAAQTPEMAQAQA